MMRKNITRKLTTSTIESVKASYVDGELTAEQLPTLTVGGKVSEAEAVKMVKKEFGKEFNVIITAIRESTGVYEIPVSEFLKYATRTE